MNWIHIKDQKAICTVARREGVIVDTMVGGVLDARAFRVLFYLKERDEGKKSDDTAREVEFGSL